jgi:hypothetical protein
MLLSEAFWEGLKKGLVEGAAANKRSRAENQELHRRLNQQQLVILQLKSVPRGKRGSALTERQIERYLASARQMPSCLDWSVLTDQQERCARLRWQCRFSVSMISRSLRIHRKTVDEHLIRAGCRLNRTYKRGRRRK